MNRESESRQAANAADNSEELLTLDEAVQFLGTSKPTLYRWLAQGDVRGLKVGKQWRFRRADLVAYLERTPLEAASAPAEVLNAEIAFFDAQLTQAGTPPQAKDETSAELPPLDRIAQQIITLAIRSRASDIHLEPTKQKGESVFLLRTRVDGALEEVRRMPMSLVEALTMRIKDMAGMNINERRVPQDGRIPFPYEGKAFDLRVSCVPTFYGEGMVMRILDRTPMLIGLDKLGLSAEDQARIRHWLNAPNGLILAAGPAGSGKTTFLYSCAQEVASPGNKTLTIEESGELLLENTTPIQVDRRAGMTFAKALRASMRQDPDILLLGEMRDPDTTEAALNAVVTGHLVLTSSDAETTTDAIRWLVAQVGAKPSLTLYSLTGITGVVALRLIRKICEHCKEAGENVPALRQYVTDLATEGGYTLPDNVVLYRGRGCPQCRNTGYRGRTGLFELLTWTPAMQEALLRGAPVEELVEIADINGRKTMLADGAHKAAQGITTLEEILRVAAASN